MMNEKYTLLFLSEDSEYLESINARFKDSYNLILISELKLLIHSLEENTVSILIIDSSFSIKSEYLNMIHSKFEDLVYIILISSRQSLPNYENIESNSFCYLLLNRSLSFLELEISLRWALKLHMQQTQNIKLQQSICKCKKQFEEKYNFFAKINHEIRTPMTGIIGLIDLMLNSHLNSEQNDYLTAMKEASEGLLQILDDVLILSKMNSKKFSLKPQMASIKKINDEITTLFKAQLKEKKLYFHIMMPDNFPPYIKIDEYRFKQILINLIANAIKFTLTGGVILRYSICELSPSSLKFKADVIDTGIGIDKEGMKILFKNFSQVGTDNPSNMEGIGLGLSICKNLIYEMGGEINVKSTKGEGSSFYITLEVEHANASITKKHIDLSCEELDLKVLIVEDIETNQKVIKLLLKSFGCTPTLASNGVEALNLSLENNFDLILMDIQMPIMDGLTATKKIKAKLASPPPIIGLSANSMYGDAERNMKAGLDDYLTKPIDKIKLYNVLKKWSQN